MRFYLATMFFFWLFAVAIWGGMVAGSTFPRMIAWPRWQYVVRIVISACFAAWAGWLLWGK